jgi:hypothetical protein
MPAPTKLASRDPPRTLSTTPSSPLRTARRWVVTLLLLAQAQRHDTILSTPTDKAPKRQSRNSRDAVAAGLLTQSSDRSGRRETLARFTLDGIEASDPVGELICTVEIIPPLTLHPNKCSSTITPQSLQPSKNFNSGPRAPWGFNFRWNEGVETPMLFVEIIASLVEGFPNTGAECHQPVRLTVLANGIDLGFRVGRGSYGYFLGCVKLRQPREETTLCADHLKLYGRCPCGWCPHADGGSTRL